MNLIRHYYPDWNKPVAVSAEAAESAENSFRMKYAQRITATGWVRVCQECGRRFPTRYPHTALCGDKCVTRRRLRLRRYRESLMSMCARVGCDRLFTPTRKSHIYCSTECKIRKNVSAWRRCPRCRKHLNRDAHARQKYCSETCRVLHFKQQQRALKKNPNLGRVLPPADDDQEV